jgi:predicted alpha/beta hydrolase
MMKDGITVDITSGDGEIIVGHYFAADQPEGAVLICGATGIRQHLYFNFCQWLNDSGYSALCFDYRGIGQSLHKPLSQVTAKKQDWGELDMPAALEWLAQKNPRIPLHLVGHSAGGQLIGLMPNHAKLSSVVQVGSSTGFVNNIRFPDRLMAKFLLCFYGPVMARILGYVPIKVLGWGEDLPLGVAQQWAQWCLNPGYVSNSFGNDIKAHFYDDFKAPILSIAATDDAIATEANIDAMLCLFPNAKTKQIRVAPEDYGLKEIGHIDFFRSKSQKMWPLIIDWFESVVTGS